METDRATPAPLRAPTSFTARRPHASDLPSFELPPPELSGLYSIYTEWSPFSNNPPLTTFASAAALLTPPSNASAEGRTGSSGTALPPFTPSGTSGYWPPPGSSQASFGFHSSSEQPVGQGRGRFSPSLNSIVRSGSSIGASDGLPPPPYELPQSNSTWATVSAPKLPAESQHRFVSESSTSIQASVSQSSPVHSQEAFARPPPTPSYYQAQSKEFSTRTITPSYPQKSHQRPYTYPLQGPVLSNIVNSAGHLSMVGGSPQNVVHGYNSGHASRLQQLYGHPQQSATNDRPFKCDQCPQSFNRNHDLKRHKRIHLAVKPFPCGYCDKSFSRKDALKRHVLVKGCGKRLYALPEGTMCDTKPAKPPALPASMDTSEDANSIKFTANEHTGRELALRPSSTTEFILPPALLTQYPALAGIDWNTLPEGPPPDEGYSSMNGSYNTSCGDEYYEVFPENSIPERISGLEVGHSPLHAPQSQTPSLAHLRESRVETGFHHEQDAIVQTADEMLRSIGPGTSSRFNDAEKQPALTAAQPVVYASVAAHTAPLSSLPLALYSTGAAPPENGTIESSQRHSMRSPSERRQENNETETKSPDRSQLEPEDYTEQTKQSDEKDLEGTTTAHCDDDIDVADRLRSTSVEDLDAPSPGAPANNTNFSESPSSGTLDDDNSSETTLAYVSELGSHHIDTPPLSLLQRTGSRATRIEALQRLERILQHLEILADELSYPATPSDSEDADGSQISLDPSAITLCNDNGFGSEAGTEANDTNEPTEGTDNSDGSNETHRPSEQNAGSAQLNGSQTGSKRPLDSSSANESDEADDGCRKRPRKSPDPSSFDSNPPTLDGRDQIPCFIDGCSGKDAHISEMMRKCAKHHLFFVCTRCYLQIDDKTKFEHHRATSEGCEPHCISSSCSPGHNGSALERRHKRKFECPPDKKASVQDRWQYLGQLRYPDRPLLSLVPQSGPSHPHGSGRAKTQRKPVTKSPLSDQFRQQLAEARNEIQNLLTQQALDTVMLDVNAKAHNEKVLRLEMVIAACVELIPRIPGSLQRMLEVDAAGALKMIEKSSMNSQAHCTQQSTAMLTPQSFSRPSQGASSSPRDGASLRESFAAAPGDFLAHTDAGDINMQYFFDPVLGGSEPNGEHEYI